MSKKDQRELGDLEGVGKATLGDFELLGIESVRALSKADPLVLFQRMCEMTNSRQDPCVYDVFACAIAQAQDPDLAANERKWWTWSRKRKAAGEPTL
jgi:hypothetical protein